MPFFRFRMPLFQIQDAMIYIQDANFQIQDVIFQIQDAIFLNSRCRITYESIKIMSWLIFIQTSVIDYSLCTIIHISSVVVFQKVKGNVEKEVEDKKIGCSQVWSVKFRLIFSVDFTGGDVIKLLICRRFCCSFFVDERFDFLN